MENTIRKIFSGKTDEEVHSDFIKYSRGVFGNKYLLSGKRQKDRWSIKTSAEFVNFLVKMCLEGLNGKVAVKGVIVSTFDLRNALKFPIASVKQFMGIKQLVIDTEVEPNQIIEAMKSFPKAFFALSFSFPNGELKVKAKAPKSAKPSSSGEKEAAPEFASLKTSDKRLVHDLFFDHPEFNEIIVRHELNIKEITLPKGESDPVKMRENAKRKGTIKRKGIVDGKEILKEVNFEA